MKIAHTAFSISSSSGGIGPVVQGMTSALSSIAGFVPTSFVPDISEVRDFQTPLKEFKCIGPSQHCFSTQLLSQITADQNDLIHCHGIWTFLARTNLAWKKSGKPYAISPHGMTMPAAMKFSRWKKMLFWPLLEKPNLNRAGFLHALSSVEAASIRKLGIKTPIVQIGNGIDLPKKSVSQEFNTQAKNGHRTLLYLGRLHPIKGLDRLIGAWQSIRTEALSNKWKLQIVGWGQEGYVQQVQNQIKNDESVIFTGPLFGEQKHTAINQASAFVLPSSSEAFPMALMEAWSHGLPAVATKTCNVLGESGHSTSIFVDGSQKDILAGIQEIMDLSDQQRQAMGDRARAIVEADYSWPTIANKFVSAYRWLLRDGPEPTELMFD